MEKHRKSQTQNEKKCATRKRLNADNKHLQQKKKRKVDSAANAVLKFDSKIHTPEEELRSWRKWQNNSSRK